MPSELAGLRLVAWICTYLVHSTLLLSLAWAVARRPGKLSLPLRERVWKLAVAGGFLTATLQLGLGLEPPVLHFALQTEVATTGERPLAPNPPTAAAHEEALAHPARPTPSDRPSVQPSTGPVSRAPAPRVLPPTAEAPQAQDEVALVQQAARLPILVDLSLRAGLELCAQLPASFPQPATEPAADPAIEPEVPAMAPEAPGPAALASAVLSRWPWIALLIWSLSALACALLFALGLRRLKRDLSGRAELTSGAAYEELQRLSLRAGVLRRVRLFVAPRIAAPLSMGWFRPAVCLPPRALCELEDDEREAMLAHEVAHLARRDPAWLFGLWIAETVCFFQPLNRLARRELGATFELAADTWAARATGQRLALASCLARIASWVVGESAPHGHRAFAAAMADALDARRPRSRLGQRIERLLDERALVEPPRRRALELVLSTGLIASLALLAPGAAAARGQRAREPAPQEPHTAITQPAAPATSSLFATAASFQRLEAEMVSLEGELALLRSELGDTRAAGRLDALLEEVEARIGRLAERRERIRSLLARARVLAAASPDRSNP